MTKSKFTYNLKLLFVGVIVWEFIFWSLLFTILYFFGFLNDGFSGDKLAFKYTNILWLNLILIPIGVVFYSYLKKNNQISNTAVPSLQKYFLSPVSSFSTFLSYFFFRNAIVFLIIAMAQPIYGNQKSLGTVESMELIVALDISNSMNTKDIDKDLSRLNIAKRALIQLINNLQGERLGVSIFAGSSYVQLPLTNDYGTAKMFIEEIQTNMLSNQGTNIAQALKTSMTMFSEMKTTKGIIIVTDGENHEENPIDFINELVEKKIQLCVLGIGTLQGGLIPNNPKRPELGYKTTNTGEQIISKVNSSMLKDLATKANGYAVVSSNPFPDLTSLIYEIKRMKRTVVDGVEFEVKETKYQIPLLISILFWSFYLCLNTISRRFSQTFLKRKKGELLCGLLMIGFSFSGFSQEWRDSLGVARAAYKAKEYAKALSYYNTSQKKAPKTIDLSDEIAQTAYKLKQFSVSEKMYSSSTLKKKEKSKKSTSFHNVGNSQMKQLNYEGAIESYKKSLRNNPNDEQTRYNLSEAIRKKKQKDKNEDNKDKKEENKNNPSKNKDENSEKKEDEKNKSSLSTKSADRMLDNLDKKDGEAKRKSSSKKNGEGEGVTGKDW